MEQSFNVEVDDSETRFIAKQVSILAKELFQGRLEKYHEVIEFGKRHKPRPAAVRKEFEDSGD